MKKDLLLIILCMFMTMQAWGQPSFFSKEIKSYPDSLQVLFYNHILFGDTILVPAGVMDTSLNLPSPHYFCIFKYNQQGDLTDSDTLKSIHGDYIKGYDDSFIGQFVDKLDNNRLVVLGYIQQGFNPLLDTLSIMITDLDGKIQKQYYFNLNGGLLRHQLMDIKYSTVSNHIYVSAQRVHYLPGGGQPSFDEYLVCLDTSLVVRWDTVANAWGYNNININKNGEPIWAFNFWKTGSPAPIRQAKLLHLDNNGQEQNLLLSPRLVNFTRLKQLEDNTYGVAAIWADSIPIIGTPVFTQNIYPAFFKLDSNLNILWQKRFYLQSKSIQTIGQSASYDFLENPDRTIIVVGFGQDTNINKFGFLHKMSAQGDSIWQRRYDITGNSPYKDERIFSISAYKSGYAIIGTWYDYYVSLSEFSGWLMLVDSTGCIVPGCQQYVSVEEIRAAPQQLILKIAPNPFSEVLAVQLYTGSKPGMELRLYDMTGRLIESRDASQDDIQHLFILPELSAGMYFLSVFHEGQLLKTEKVIKQ
jgi:hypothetical protein